MLSVSPQAPLCTVPLWTTASRQAGKHPEWNAASQDHEPSQVSEKRNSLQPGGVPSLAQPAVGCRWDKASLQHPGLPPLSLPTRHVLLTTPPKDSWEVGLPGVEVTKAKVDTKGDRPSAPYSFGENWSLSGKRL